MLLEAIGIALRLALTLPGGEAASPPLEPQMVLGPAVLAPVGYVNFCVRRPDQCQDDVADGAAPQMRAAFAADPQSPDLEPQAETEDPPARAIYLTKESWTAVMRVNQTINASLRPMSDERAFGVSNYWTLPIEDEHRPVGNCKHYALEKRNALVQAGLPAGALSLALVRTRQGELHAVLILATDRGDVVLDNLTDAVRGWRETGYRWLVRQTPGRPLKWVAVAASS